MIPSRRWFPAPLQDRAAWFANFDAQFTALATSLGFTATDQAKVTSDNDAMQFFADSMIKLDNYADAIRQYRNILTEGHDGDPTPAQPANLVLNSAGTATTGIFERLDDLVKRIRVSPTYNDEIGALLGILPSKSDPGEHIPETDLKPTIKASDSVGGYKFQVNVSRLGMQAYKIQVQRKDSSVWQDVSFATSNPATITVTPSIAGDPERILVRAILLEKNEPVGIPSDPTYVTVNP